MLCRERNLGSPRYGRLTFQEVSLMSPNTSRHFFSLAFLNPAKINFRQGVALTTVLLIATAGIAQQPSPPSLADSHDNDQASLTTSTATASLPAGTRLALVLTQPIQTRYTHRGDDIYAQVTSPVTAGDQVVIPPGTFVQGTVDKLTRSGGRGELALKSMSITFPDGYVTPVAGPITLESDDGYAFKDPGGARQAGAIGLAIGGVGLGALIGHSVANASPQTISNTLPQGCTGPPPGCLTSSVTAPGSSAKGTVIGVAVGGAIGAVASIALLVHSRDFFLDAGSPVRVVLQQPITLPQDDVAAAVRDAGQHPTQPQPVSPRPRPAYPSSDNGYNTGTCYTPGTPGVDIPGTPGINGSPGTPPVHIPGTPATLPIPHPCP
jgi:hypothetical protein